jgi:hypothetical protein
MFQDFRIFAFRITDNITSFHDDAEEGEKPANPEEIRECKIFRYKITKWYMYEFRLDWEQMQELTNENELTGYRTAVYNLDTGPMWLRNVEKGALSMIRQIINQLKLGIQLSPLLSVLNIIFVFLSSLSILIGQIAIRNVYAAVQPGGTSIAGWIVWLAVFFINMSIFGSSDNMQNMIIEAALKKTRSLLHNLFMYKSYRLEQDSFYDSKKLDKYEYVKGNLDAISEVSTIMLNRFLACFFTLILISVSIVAIDVLVVIAVIVSAIAVSVLNKYIAAKKVALNIDHVADERHADYYKQLLTAREHAKETHLGPNKSWLIEKWKYHFDKALLPKGRFERSSIVLGDIVRFFEDCFPYLFAMYFIAKHLV